jgi:LPXTG-site transpeptidase (sortase) family protein
VILAGAGGVLLVLGTVVAVGAPRLSHEIHSDDPVVVPECVREQAIPVEASPSPGGPPEPSMPTADPARGRPVALRIRDLGVEASVTPVGLGADGVLVPPSDYTTVGWWSEGAEPGSVRGTVLITGHTVRAGGGVFDDLASIEPGAVVDVVTAEGRITYRVDVVEDYSKEQLASISEELFSQTVVGQLVLVTCSDYFGGSYHGNTVVVAHPRPRGSGSTSEPAE